MNVEAEVARELGLPAGGVAAVVRLLAEGATVPFVARYRKEATGGLDEVQIRAIAESHAERLELEARRGVVLEAIREQGKLDPTLESKLRAAASKAELEDLYLPFRPKRRTRASIARERGLEPLAELILSQPKTGRPDDAARPFVGEDVPDVEAALAGARDVIAEIMTEDATVRAFVRKEMAERGIVESAAVKAKTKGPTKFEAYYEFKEPAKAIPSHRYLALCRGEEEGVLKVSMELAPEPIFARIATQLRVDRKSPFAMQLAEAIQDGMKRLLFPSIENEVRGELKARADREAAAVFAENLRNLLLAAPLGPKPVIGVDPGLRTGCKCAALDATGQFLETITVHLTGEAQSERAARDLGGFVLRHKPAAIAVGNGTGGRETEAFVRKLIADRGLDVVVVSVNEAGASVYSASDLAREEFPDLDLTIRGAISIARRLQDPLAELVKIDPKSIGVGQYQHDVKPALLEAKLDEVVESSVNHVGVDLNTASAPLLARVAGIGPSLAKKIVKHRDKSGGFRGRSQLLDVSGLGPRAFEQAAGFLRVRGENPLDASAVHPERYPVVERIAKDLGVELGALVGNAALARRIEPKRYASEVGELTLVDIVRELEKPGRDPRESFVPPKFDANIQSIEDLRPEMVLEGVVTNVTAFGAFVDVGVHQDGLVHVSQLADKFVKDPKDVVKVGDRLKVRVLDVDLARKRISLSAKNRA